MNQGGAGMEAGKGGWGGAGTVAIGGMGEVAEVPIGGRGVAIVVAAIVWVLGFLLEPLWVAIVVFSRV